MAGSGVAIRLHEFKEFLHCEHLRGQNRASRQGRDTQGLYPGQLGRVHAAHSRDYGLAVQSGSQSLRDYQQSFDVQMLRAVSVRPEVMPQRPLQTTYHEHYGLLSFHE